MSRHPRSAHPVVLLVVSVVLFFLGLGSLGLTDRDEGSNAEAAREMVQTGDWISPTLNYQPRFAKPVFIYWLIGGAYLALGVNEFAARLHSAVFAVALVLLQYYFLRRLRGPAVALFGALMLLLNVEMVALGRLALTDSVLTFLTTLSLYGFWLGLHGAGRERHAIWLLYVGMGLAMLTKGPVGVVVPLLAIVPYLTVTRRWRQFRSRGHLAAGLFLCAVIASPWYAAMLARHGSSYLVSARENTIGRFAHTIGGHGGTPLFYVPVLLFGFFPWSGFMLAGLYQTVSEAWSSMRAAVSPAREAPAADAELDLFAAIWVIAVFLFFTMSATRLPHYLAPLFPAAAILAASYWHRCQRADAAPGLRAAVYTTMGLGGLLGFALAATPLLYERYLGVILRHFPAAGETTPGLAPVAAGLVLATGSGMVAYLGMSAGRRRAGAFWVAGTMVAVLLLLVIQFMLPRLNASLIAPAQQLARTAGSSLAPEDRLILYGPERPSLIFYSQRQAVVIRPGEEARMRAVLTGPWRTLILLPSRLRPRLPPPEARSLVTLQERGGYSLLESRPVPGEGATPATG